MSKRQAGTMMKQPYMTVQYSPHNFDDRAEGHLFIHKRGACTITLTGAASMSQEELNEWGTLIASLLNQ